MAKKKKDEAEARPATEGPAPADAAPPEEAPTDAAAGDPPTDAAAGDPPTDAATDDPPAYAAADDPPADGAADDPPADGAADDPPTEASEAVPTDEDEAVADMEDDAEDPVTALAAEVADLKDKLLRALAEAENVRRRAEREKADATKYAISNFAREMLSVADNLRRALDSVVEAAEGEAPPSDQLVVGVEMTEREMLSAFERCGIERIDALGQRFDHNRHEAMFEIEDKSVPAGTVVQQMESGYVLNGRLLRPAKVGLAKGGPKPEAEEPIADEAAEAGAGAASTSSSAYEQRVDADKPADSGTQIDTEL